MTMTAADLFGVLVAVLGGAAVGIERQWSGHAEGPSARFAGVRTFAMLGAVAGLGGWLSTRGERTLAAILIAGGVAIAVAGYVASSRRDVDGTTEVAAVLMMAAGVLAGMGLYRLASGILAVEVLLLVEKSRVHSIVRRIDDVELRAGVRFAVMALVVLPLLPEGPYGPFGAIRPRQLWLFVLFFSGISFLGRELHRIAGPRSGFLLSGAIGGLVSSTNVTFTFARSSRRDPSLAAPLAAGAIAANLVLYGRVCAAVAVLNGPLAPLVVRYVAAPALVVAIALAIGTRAPRAREVDSGLPNPLQIRAALQMAALFQIVLIAVRVVQSVWGRSGVLTTAAILGLTDVDALTVSMARGVAPATSLETAALAIAVGILTNTVLKAGVALVFGGRRFGAAVAGTLAASAVAAVAAIALIAP